MRFNHVQSNLWAISILWFSCLGIDSPAFSQQPSTVSDIDTTESPIIFGYTCQNLGADEPQPLGEFREAVLNTATVAARQPGSLSESGKRLMQLSPVYDCFGEKDISKSLILESLATVNKIEDVDTQFDLVMSIVAVYSIEAVYKVLSDDQRDELLDQAIALTLASPTYPQNQFERLAKIAGYHLRSSTYEKVKSVVDLAGSPENRADIVRFIFKFYGSDSAEDRAIAQELFPEVELTDHNQNYEADFHQIPLVRWINQFNHSAIVQFTQQPNDIDEFITNQVSTIELLPDTFSQTYSYVVIGQALAREGRLERALSLLEIAAQKNKQVKDTAVPDDVRNYFGGLNLDSTLGTAFALSGDAERGLSVILDAYSLSESREKISALLLTARHLIFQEQRTSIPLFLEAAEQAARSLDNPEIYLISIATAYAEIDKLENAQRLTQEILEAAEDTQSFTASLLEETVSGGDSSENAFGYSSVLTNLLSLLIEVDYPEAILKIAPLINDQGAIGRIVVQLIREKQHDIAWQIFELITSPLGQINALVAVSEEYQRIGNSDLAFDFAVRALNISQSDELLADRFFQESIDLLAYGYEPEANRNELMEVSRETLISIIVYLAQSPEQTSQLLQLIEDDSIRENISAYLLSSNVAEEISDSGTALAGDEALSDAAYRAASEGRFQEAIAAIASMESPYEQSGALIYVADHHADSTTVLDTEIKQLLEKIENDLSTRRVLLTVEKGEQTNAGR